MIRDKFVGLYVVATIISASGTGFAAENEIGKAEFLNSCASCHGTSGRGDGIMAKALVKKPADLSALQRKNHGNYPAAMVAATIDGRFIVPGHGDRQMPIWGNVFRSEAGQDKAKGDISASDRISRLVEYIRTIQRP